MNVQQQHNNTTSMEDKHQCSLQLLFIIICPLHLTSQLPHILHHPHFTYTTFIHSTLPYAYYLLQLNCIFYTSTILGSQTTVNPSPR